MPAIRKVLKLAGLSLEQIDLVELNEALAAQVLACLRKLPFDADCLNVNGGASPWAARSAAPAPS